MILRRMGCRWVLYTVSIRPAAVCMTTVVFILLLSLQDTDLLASFSVEGDKLMIDTKLDK